VRQVAIVTGAASGIGLALSRALVRHGYVVVLADADERRARHAAGELAAVGPGGAEHARVDVCDAAAVAGLVEAAVGRHGHLDLMVNNAGVGGGGEVRELTLADWHRMIDVNLLGVVHGVHAAYPVMVDQAGGHIVNTASMAGLVPAPMMTPYATTKHAVVGLSRSLRAEAARYGVRVTVVCPGFVDTPFLGTGGSPGPTRAERARQLALHNARGRLYPPERLAQDVLRGIERNRALVVAPASARLFWRLARWAPALVDAYNARALARRHGPRSPSAATVGDIGMTGCRGGP
jgi:NAD(P)-dependent dehydrogenase (short-subunit alcohol dehydrogenase family)